MLHELCWKTVKIRNLAEKAQKFVGFFLEVGVLEFSLERSLFPRESPPEDFPGATAGIEWVAGPKGY